MFQSFTATSTPDQGPPRLKTLRDLIAERGLTGFWVPRADAHQGEYVAPRDARLEWLTGFTGSAGFCLVLPQIAGVFIDGRYRLQVRSQVALDHFTPVPWPETKPGDWLRDQLPQGGVIGFDPWLHTRDQIDKLEKALEGSGIVLPRVEPDHPALRQLIAQPVAGFGFGPRHRCSNPSPPPPPPTKARLASPRCAPSLPPWA